MAKYFDKWNNGEIDVVEINGRLFALHGWNGETWLRCWECLDKWTMASEKVFEVRPVHRFEIEEIDFETLEENSPEWDRAVEIVDFEIV